MRRNVILSFACALLISSVSAVLARQACTGSGCGAWGSCRDGVLVDTEQGRVRVNGQARICCRGGYETVETQACLGKRVDSGLPAVNAGQYKARTPARDFTAVPHVPTSYKECVAQYPDKKACCAEIFPQTTGAKSTTVSAAPSASRPPVQ